MKKVDFVVIGCGIAGLCTAVQLRSRGLRVVVLDSEGQSATSISGGTIHPVLLRHYNRVWFGEEFWTYAQEFYTVLEGQLNRPFIEVKGLIKLFDSLEERALWQERRAEVFWAHYLNPLDDKACALKGIRTPYGYGTSDEVWRFSPPKLLKAYKSLLQREQCWQSAEIFAKTPTELRAVLNGLGLDPTHIVLAQGFAQQIWPSNLGLGGPIIAKGGEYMIIESPELKLEVVLKDEFFIIPLGQDKYQVGATYIHKNQDSSPTIGRDKMTAALDGLLTLPYVVLEYWTGLRPTTLDRKPILGLIDRAASVYTINGLNSRGLLMAPLLSDWLVDSIIEGGILPSEVSIGRFFSAPLD
jgi:glycine oxidase